MGVGPPSSFSDSKGPVTAGDPGVLDGGKDEGGPGNVVPIVTARRRLAGPSTGLGTLSSRRPLPWARLCKRRKTGAAEFLRRDFDASLYVMKFRRGGLSRVKGPPDEMDC